MGSPSIPSKRFIFEIALNFLAGAYCEKYGNTCSRRFLTKSSSEISRRLIGAPRLILMKLRCMRIILFLIMNF